MLLRIVLILILSSLPGLLIVNPGRFCGGGISDSGAVESLCVLGVSLVLM